MDPLRNIAREQLEAGQVAVGLGVRCSRGPEVARVAAGLGYHYLFIDMEHSALDFDAVAQICVAGLDAGVMPNVRVPANSPVFISRVLDAGALGVVVPHVDTPEDALQAVAAARYPPVGQRSGMGPMIHFGYASMPTREIIAQMNRAMLVTVMLETEAAVDNVERIAAIDGIDVISVGVNDLTISMGLADQLDNPVVEAICRRVAAAAHKNGKYVHIGGIYDPALIRKQVTLGCQMIQAGQDNAFIVQGARAALGRLSELPRPGSAVGW